MKIWRAWLVFVLVVAAFAACGGTETEEPPRGGTEGSMPTETTAGESSPDEAATESPPAEEVSEADYWDGSGFGDRPVYQAGAAPHISVALHETLDACDFSDEDAEYVVDTFESTGANILISSGHGGSSIELVDLGGGDYELQVECGSE